MPSLKQNLLTALELPPEMLCTAPILTLTRRDGLRITGCLGILGYDPACVCLRLTDGDLRIAGSDLTLCSFFGQTLSLSGHVAQVCFLTGKGGEMPC